MVYLGKSDKYHYLPITVHVMKVAAMFNSKNNVFFSDNVCNLGFTVIIDMRGSSSWNTVKPVLKVLQDFFSNVIHTVHIIKPENFWQKQRTNIASQKYKFEVRLKSVFQCSMTLKTKIKHAGSSIFICSIIS